MSRQTYIDTIRQLTTSFGLQEQDARQIAERGALAIDGILFSFVHDDKISPNLLLAYCDFGEVLKGKEAQIYKALMEINLAMYIGAGPTFGISPQTGRIVLALSHALDGLNIDKLRNSLGEIADWAKQWRATHFLTRPNEREPANPHARKGASRLERLSGMRAEVRKHVV
jgi:hypothetical protein